MSADTTDPAPFHVVRATVTAVERVSPVFVRITFGGPDLDGFGTPGRTLDQRIKLIFPAASGALPALSTADANWYQAWLALPEDERGSMRTYSIRHLTVDADGATAVSVDFVLHLEPGGTGPASTWASRASVGDELLIIGPRRGRFDGGGIEYDPGLAREVMLVGDETAAPAIARILEDGAASLSAADGGSGSRAGIEHAPNRGIACIEVPTADDILPIDAPEGFEVRWLLRGSAAPGSQLLDAVLAEVGEAPGGGRADAAAGGADAAAATAPEEDPAIAADPEYMPWETPQYSQLGEQIADPSERADATERYYWIAGESRVVTTLRRHLVKGLGVDRAQVAFMGYWKQGVSMRG